jgi:adenylyltransferase/sulfurtransferase
VFLEKPNIYGSVFVSTGKRRSLGRISAGRVIAASSGAAAGGTVPNCAEAGVLGVLPGIIGTMQAVEAIKLILGIGDSLLGRLLHFDALKMKFREFKLRRDRSARSAASIGRLLLRSITRRFVVPE